jgi:hypothetical protein
MAPDISKIDADLRFERPAHQIVLNIGSKTPHLCCRRFRLKLLSARHLPTSANDDQMWDTRQNLSKETGPHLSRIFPLQFAINC